LRDDREVFKLDDVIRNIQEIVSTVRTYRHL